MRNPGTMVALLLLLAAPARAQITIPNTFTNGTIADANDVNANFTALGNQALNRTGGTMTGDLLFNDALYDIGKVGATRPRDGFFSRNLTVGGVLTAASVIGSGSSLVLSGPVTTGNLTVAGTLGVTGATTLSSTLSAGATTLSSLGVVGNAVISGTVNAGASTLASLGVTGAATVGTTLGVTGTLAVSGVASIAGTARVGFLQIAGTTSSFPGWRNTGAVMEAVLADQSNYATVRAQNVLTQAAGSQFTDLAVVGAETVGGTLGVTGTSTLGALNAGVTTVSSLNAASGTGAITGGNLTAGGNLQVNGSTNTTGTDTAAAMHSTGTLTVDTNATVGGTLGVTGTLSGSTIITSANIASAATVSGALVVAAGANSTGMQDVGFSMTTWGTTASAANAQVANGNVLRLVTSLRAAKYSIMSIPITDARKTVMGLRGVLYQSLIDDDPRQWSGFIAEEVARVNPILALYDEQTGHLQSVAYDRIPAYLVPVAQDHEARIAALEALLKARQP